MLTTENNLNVNTVNAFRELHKSGCFIIPNPWDIGTAKYLKQLGFKALATTSAGYAFTRGMPDEVSALTRDDMLTHIKEIVNATSLPVNADFQNGYAHNPEEVAANVKLCVQTGAAGLSIEDATGDKKEPLYEFSLAVERVRAARTAIDSTGIPVVLTARCEAYLVDYPDSERTVLDRLVAFADAGADCLFAPGVKDVKLIAAIVKAVEPKSVNIIISAPVKGISFSLLRDLGVRRISVGSALARVAWGAFIKASKEIAETGSFDTLTEAAPFSELNEIFSSII